MMSYPSKHKIAVIIPTHERFKEICTLLSSMDRLESSVYQLEIIVCDDGSSSPLDQVIQAELPGLHISVLRNERALGPAATRNRAVAATRADYLWFLDSDTEIVSPKTAEVLIGRLTTSPHVGAVGGVWEPFNSEWRAVRLFIWPNFLFSYFVAGSPSEATGVVASLGTCNLMMRREDFEAIGGFDELLLRDEDVDLCLRLRARGFTMEQLEGGFVRHHLSQTGRDSGMLAHFRDPAKYFHAMLDTRARLLARHRPVRAPLIPVLDSVLLPLMGVQVLRRRCSINRPVKRSDSSRLEWLIALVSEVLRSYVTGWKYLLRDKVKHAEPSPL